MSNFMVGILVETMKPKGHFEINRPSLELLSSASEVFDTFISPRMSILIIGLTARCEKLGIILETKGQFISKCPFGFIVSSKIPTKKFVKFCPRIGRKVLELVHCELRNKNAEPDYF